VPHPRRGKDQKSHGLAAVTSNNGNGLSILFFRIDVYDRNSRQPKMQCPIKCKHKRRG
jgi:hypothetical protein